MIRSVGGDVAGRETSFLDQPIRSQQVLCAIVNVLIGLTSAAAAAAECHGGGALR